MCPSSPTPPNPSIIVLYFFNFSSSPFWFQSLSCAWWLTADPFPSSSSFFCTLQNLGRGFVWHALHAHILYGLCTVFICSSLSFGWFVLWLWSFHVFYGSFCAHFHKILDTGCLLYCLKCFIDSVFPTGFFLRLWWVDPGPSRGFGGSGGK